MNIKQRNKQDFLKYQTKQDISIDDIISNSQGIDTIRLIAKYKTICNLLDKNGLILKNKVANLPINPYIKSVQKNIKQDSKKRYKKDNFKLSVEYAKISNNRGLSSYIIIIKNTPYLFDYALKNKKAKDTYCQIIFTGLHQPSKKISSENIAFISKVLRRKAFKLHSIDIATDYQSKEPISHQAKQTFKKRLGAYSNDSYISKGNSLYCNDVEHINIEKVLIYNKYIKQATYQKQSLNRDLIYWKRKEITIKPSNKTNFINFIKGNEFIQVLSVCDDISRRLKVSGFKKDYLLYQINAFLDMRVLNNLQSKKRFNSKQSLQRFKRSSFKPFKFANY